MTRADLRHPIASRWDVSPVARSEAMLPGNYQSALFPEPMDRHTWYTTPRKTRKKARTMISRIPRRYAVHKHHLVSKGGTHILADSHPIPPGFE
jgi:hypothetical protein